MNDGRRQLTIVVHVTRVGAREVEVVQSADSGEWRQ